MEASGGGMLRDWLNKSMRPTELHDRAETALVIAFIVVVSSLFVAGIAVLVMVKKGYFKVSEGSLFIRIIKCITISSGVTLLLMVSSCAGSVLHELFLGRGIILGNSLGSQFFFILPDAIRFGADLAAGLVVADFISRGTGRQAVIQNSLRVGLFFAFTSIAHAFGAIQYVNSGEIGVYDFVSGIVYSPIVTIVSIVRFVYICLLNPMQVFGYAVGYCVDNMSNVFNYEPIFAAIVLIIGGFSLLSANRRREGAR